MRIAINKKNLLRIREKINRKIRLFIGSGEMTPGEPLPSARNMAALLRVKGRGG
jgi:DNA-binding transcriptional regulator YhcF (GntR family)